MKRFLLFFTSLLIGFGLLVWTIRAVGLGEIGPAFLIFSGWEGVIILLLTALILLTGLLKWRVILKSQGYVLSNRKLLGPYLAGFSLSYLFPMVIFGGEIFKGYIVKERFSIPLKKVMSSVILDKILEATFLLATALIGLFLFFLKIGLPSKNLTIILAGILVFFSAGIGFFYFKSFRRESMVRFFLKFFNHKKFFNEEPLDIEKEIFEFFKFKNKALWEAIGLAFLRVVITWIRCWALILFLGKSIGVFSSLSVLGFYYFALMIPIPAALGSHEVIQSFSFGGLGLGKNVAFAFTMIQRGAELVLVFMGVMISIKLGIVMLKNILFRKLGYFLNTQN